MSKMFVCALLHCQLVLLLLAGMPSTLAEIVFTAPPQSVAIPQGSTLVLNCSATDTANPSAELRHQWLYFEDPVDEVIPRASYFLNHSLYVPMFDEYGRFQCRVWLEGQPEGAVLSEVASILPPSIFKFKTHPGSQTVSEGELASLECVTGRSAPPAQVYWQTNGERFTGGVQKVARYGAVGLAGAEQTSMLLLFNVTFDLAGSYQCVAINPLTNRIYFSNEAKITVLVLQQTPYITKVVPSQLLLPSGQPYMRDCPIAGWPQPDIVWYKDGRYLDNSTETNVYVLLNGSLLLDPTDRVHSGRYACIGTSAIGSVATLSTNISVAYLAVEFGENPQDTTAIAGQKAKLTCRPPPSFPSVVVEWFKDNSRLDERTGDFPIVMTPEGDLEFGNVQLGDQGHYVCVAYNKFSSPSSRNSPPAVLTVQGSPVIVEPPLATKIIKGQLLTLNCKFEGQPQVSIAWFKDGELLLPGGRVTFRDAGQEMIISSINKLDEGLYLCRGTNIYGFIQSSPVLIDVIVGPEVVQGPEDQTVAVGQDAKLDCSFYGDPTPEVNWYRAGRKLPKDPAASTKYRVTGEGLWVLAANTADQGEYTCVGTNEGGERRVTASLYVQEIPVLVSYHVNQTVNMSQSVVMFCDAEGDPEATISWTYNGTDKLPVGASVTAGDGSTVVITSAQLHHTGTYTCLATNPIGQDQRSAFLYVQEAAQVLGIKGVPVVNQGSTLQLTCQVTGVPRPAATWYFNNNPVTPSREQRVTLPSHAVLRVQFVTAADGGTYKCVAENPAGRQERTIEVFVRETPLPPYIDHVRAFSTTSVNITWVPAQQDPYITVQHFVVQYKTQPGLQYSLYREDIPRNWTNIEVGGLEPATEYLFRMAAKNQVGIGVYSAVLAAETLESAPSAPRNLRLLISDPTSVRLQWETPAVTNGDLSIYQLQYRKRFIAEEFKVDEVTSMTFPVQHWTVGGLQPFTTYVFKVRAANLQGGVYLWGDFTPEIEVTTQATAPSVGPSKVQLMALTSRSIQVSWETVPVEYHYGPLTGYVVTYWRTQPVTEKMTLEVGAATTQTTIPGLLPWQQYSVQVAGRNNIGTGAQSSIRNARTKAEAPSGRPQDVRLQALTSTSIRVSWKDVPELEHNSDISGYVVWYQATADGDPSGQSDYVNSPDTFTLIIGGLSPWTVYKVKVQAFTTQVQDGFGPLTVAKEVKTPDDVPDEVSSVSSEVGSHDLVLSWEPPESPNGIIEAYIVLITRLETPANERRSKRAVIDVSAAEGEGAQRVELPPDTTQVTLQGLQPDTAYHVGVAARTRRGVGTFWNTTVATKPVSVTQANEEPGTESTTVPVAMETTAALVGVNKEVVAPEKATRPGLSQQELVGVIVGSVIGGLLVVVLLGLVLFVCCTQCRDSGHTASYPAQHIMEDSSSFESSSSDRSRNKPPQRTIHPDQPQGVNGRGNGHTRTTSGTGYPVTSDETSAEPYTTTGQPYNTTGQPYNTTGQPYNTTGPAAHGYKPQAVYPGTNILGGYGDGPRGPGSSVRAAASSTSSLNALIERDHLQRGDVYTLSYPRGIEDSDRVLDPRWRLPSNEYMQGYDNAGFDNEADLSASNPSFSSTGISSRPPNLQPNVNSRRSRRMQPNVAAAIAAQRNRESSVFSHAADTDALIDRESMVVYKERTAL